MNLAYLERVDPARNMLRFYAIRIAPTLFGEWAVVREWGRIGAPGRQRHSCFASEADALAAGSKARQEKERRGYQAG
jgi:predicted DNA-binding WGR domain protein